MTTLGIRNHNPGNIERKAGVVWEGQAERQGGRFVKFTEPKWGIRAIARVLITYADARKARDGSRIDTVREFIERWAPESENDTDAYSAHVAQVLGVKPSEALSIKEPETMRALVAAIIKHENGVQPYTDAQIDAGLVLAGIEPVRAPLQSTRTIKGAQVAAGGTGLLMVSEVAAEAASQIQPLIPYLDSLRWVFMALVLVGIGVTVWARMDDREKGLR